MPHSTTALVYCFLALSVIDATSALHLTGVTSEPDHPRAEVWSSFVHELIGEIAEYGQFTYNLRMQSSSTGTSNNGRPSSVTDSLVSEVFNNLADFAISDIEVTPERRKLVDFSRPFLKSSLAALVRKHPPPQTVTEFEDSAANTDTRPEPASITVDGGKQTIQDGNKKNEMEASNTSISMTTPATAHHPPSSGSSGNGGASNQQAPTSMSHSLSDPPAGTLRSLLQRSSRIAVANSFTERFFRTSKNPFVYHLLPSSVPNLRAGVRLVNTSDEHVLISDTARLDLVASTECHLRVVRASSNIPGEIGTNLTLDFAIALKKDSPFYQLIDNALEQFESSGGLRALVEQHWTDYCTLTNPKKVYEFNDDQTNGHTSRSVCSFFTSLLSLFMVLFMFSAP